MSEQTSIYVVCFMLKQTSRILESKWTACKLDSTEASQQCPTKVRLRVLIHLGLRLKCLVWSQLLSIRKLRQDLRHGVDDGVAVDVPDWAADLLMDSWVLR